MATIDQKLSPEQDELVAVGASVGAGCHPCVDHHLKAGARAGLDGETLLATVTSAERVTAEAAVRMGDHVRAKLGPTVTEPALLSHLEETLASLGAALGANDAANIERQLRTALDSGATRPQLAQAIATAKTVQENAARIHLRQAERLLDTLTTPGDGPDNEAEGERCGCGAQPADPPGDKPPVVDRAGDDAATNRSKGPYADCTGSMAELFAGSCKTNGAATAMANHRRWCPQPLAPAETDDLPTAARPAGRCTQEG